MIWGALAIPLIAVPILRYWFPRRVVWWELAVPILVSVAVIAICKFSVQTLQTTDTEYWGGWVVNAEYYEAWDEEVSCRHPKYEKRRDSKGNEYEVQVGYKHNYDVDDHSAYWQLHDSNGQTISISSGLFNSLCRQFGNRKFVDLHRSYHSRDGDLYVCAWDGKEQTLEPVTTTHFYQNKVQASSSVFNFPKISPKDYGLYEYPKVVSGYQCRSIIGACPDQEKANRRLDLLNSRLGRSKQIHVWILVFKNRPAIVAEQQKQYWKNGNKNELVVNVGINDKDEVDWVNVFSWTDQEKFKVDVRSALIEQSGRRLNLVEFINWLEPAAVRGWERKPFADFSYLTVTPPGWAVALTYLLTLLATAISSIWAIANKIEER